MHQTASRPLTSGSEPDGSETGLGAVLRRAFSTADGSAIAYPARYELLDGLRGLAALAVVLAHHGAPMGGHDAVLVFFVISGYCIAGAASGALQGGAFGAAAFRRFLWRRLRRIYPPYALSLALFALTRVLREHLGRGVGVPTDVMVWLRSLTLTQWTYLVDHPAAAPMQNPALMVAAHWSLNYEEQFYLIVALSLLFCGSKVQRLPIALGVITVGSLLWLGVAGGDVFHGVFCEYWPHFAVGAGLYLVLCRTRVRIVRTIYGGALIYVACRAAGAALGWLPATSGRLVAEFLVIGLVGTALLLARPYSAVIARSLAWRPIALLGTISYSLYLIHQFNLTLTNSMATTVAGASAPFWAHTTVAVALQIVLATMFWYVCERPFLNQPLRDDERKPAPRPAAGVDAP